MRVLLFDIDGTLLASLRAGVLAMNRALETEFGVNVPIDEHRISGMPDRVIARTEFARHGIADSAENWGRFHDGYVRRLPDLLHLSPGRVLPGIPEALAELAPRKDLLLGLLTGNVPRGAKIKLGHHGLYERFAFGAYGDDVADRNEIARNAWRELTAKYGTQLAPSDVIVVGDTPLDIACARTIGARAVAVATGLHGLEALRPHNPDLLLADLADWRPLLELCR